MHISSPQNERIKHIVRLREDRRQREREGLMLVEGWDEFLLAMAAGHVPRTAIFCPDITDRSIHLDRTEMLSVTRAVFEKISSRENPDGWMAIFPVPQRALNDMRLGERPLVVVVEAVEKPGNLGAILRTGDAAGVDALIVCDPRVDLYGPNVVRASRGTIFSVRVVAATRAEAFGFLKERGIRIVAATPSAEQPYTSEDLRGPIAIAVGTEKEGLTDFWLQHADAKVLIPMLGKVNSLNVSVATALIIYEAVRQRRA